MARLPNVGDDSGTWGTILNEYLAVSHTPEGKLMLEKWADNASRPATPTTNQVGYNEGTQVIEQYNGTSWVTLAGGIQNNTIDPTKLNAQAEMYDDFSMKPNGYTLTTGTLPIVGNPYQIQVNTTIKTTPLIESGSLIGANETLYYLGGEHTDIIKNISFELEWKASLNPNAIPVAGVTISIADNPLFTADQTIPSGSRIALPVNMLHMSFSNGGPNGFGINTAIGANFNGFATNPSGSFWGPTNTGFIPYDTKQIVSFSFRGDEVSVSALGYTRIFKDPRVSQGGIGKWWWIETTGNTSTIREYVRVSKIWINSPSIDLAPGKNQPFSEILSRLSSGGTVLLPKKIHLIDRNVGLTSFPTGNPSDTDVLAVAGTIMTSRYKAKPYQNHGTYNPPHRIYSVSAPVSSAAPSNNLNLGPNISFFGLSQLGERDEFVLRGYFADNGNVKRLKINSGAIGDMFDSGDLTTANKEWEIRLTRTVQTGIFLSVNITFTIDGQNPILRYFSSNYNVAFNANLKVTGTSAGDVVLRNAEGLRYTI